MWAAVMFANILARCLMVAHVTEFRQNSEKPNSQKVGGFPPALRRAAGWEQIAKAARSTKLKLCRLAVRLRPKLATLSKQ